MLKVENLDAGYGDLQVLWDVSLQVERGTTVALVGPNGAGKSTTLKTIAGLMQPDSGTIHFDGNRIDSRPSHQIVNLGLSLVPEWKGVFYTLTVAENLALGAFPPSSRAQKDQKLAEILETFPILGERKVQRASTLSGGERQLLGIGRALMSRPSLLMLDEPSLGLAPLIVEHIFEVLRKVNQEGVSILVVEQNIRLALEIADHAYIIENGRIIDQGPGERLLRDPRIKEAYLGL